MRDKERDMLESQLDFLMKRIRDGHVDTIKMKIAYMEEYFICAYKLKFDERPKPESLFYKEIFNEEPYIID